MTDESGTEWRFEVLGPLRAWRGDAEIPLGSPQQRSVLAMLVLREGTPVSIGDLVDGLWGEAPPAHAVAALRTYVGRLRAAFGHRARDRVLVSAGSGYRLAPGLHTDLGDFTRELADAEAARTSGDPAGAHAILLAALARWRDEPLAGLPGPYARAQRARLAEHRLAALATRLEVDLTLGRHAEAVAELTELVRRHPLREHWYALLMRALHESGRHEEALARYAELRDALDRELGCEPGEDLRALHARLLAGPTPGAGERPPRAVPAQLPADITDFAGRARQTATVRAALTAGIPVAISGTGGVGKTALAVHVAHAVRTRFPGGQLYADLGGAEPQPAAPAEVLAEFLHALGVPRAEIPAAARDRSATFKSLVDGRKVLVFLDNARDVEQIESLLPGGEGNGVLLTGRAPLTAPGFRPVPLGTPPPEEALSLLTGLVGELRVGAERPAALKVLSACGFLPLAIRIIGARLASRPSWTIASLAERLAGERRRLRELRIADLAVETTFELGYTRLESAQRRAFRLLSVIDGARFSPPAAAAVLDVPEDTALALVESLVDAGLLEEPTPKEYRFHNLVKLYARQRGEAEDETAERSAALTRLVDFALATTRNAYRAVEPEGVLADRLGPTTSPGLPFARAKDAYRWVTVWRAALVATVRRAAENPGCPLLPSAELLFVVCLLADDGAASRDFARAGRAIARRAEGPEEKASAARAHVVLGRVAAEHGYPRQAEEERVRALRLSREIDDRLLIATCTLASGIIALETGRHAEASAALDEALAVYRALGDRPGELYSLVYRARAQLGAGNAADGLATAERAVRVSRACGGPGGLTAHTALDQLGTVLAELGRTDDAIEVHRESLRLARRNGGAAHEAATLVRLAELSLRAGRPGEAMDYARQASLTSQRVEHARLKAFALDLRRRAMAVLAARGGRRAPAIPAQSGTDRHEPEREPLGRCGGCGAR
ncbi:AfsR/SARP family transcriptional regulator [Amycolatopsis samaneae]|uniref:BTAD domain-containing putative transcriptional regulator n=1 Tax=Amycolatopsis samaneae TaxID=664691 RepID=A0ABW5GS12_9PSEU